MSLNDHRSAPPLWTGLPQTAYSALTPAGEVEQAAKVAEGFRQRRQGWRRVVFVAGVGVLGLMAVFMLVFALFGSSS
ncbi:hypothetical protein AB0J80_15590 [Actinoplanes sp. NPDC049548]|uniref:hypothetical protein n=1 Tax=Actinoplanes sp. NPDC049548 TaxID=3155152 RepID=UPI0034292A38